MSGAQSESEADDSGDLKRALLAGLMGEAVGVAADLELAHSGGFMAVGTAALASWVMPRLADEVRHRQQLRAGEALGVAAERVDATTVAAFVARVDSPRKQDLTWAVVQAAAQTDLTQKVRALGRVLGDGLNSNDALLDHTFLVLGALRDMETPHVRVLAWFGADVAPSLARPGDPNGWTLATWHCPMPTDAGLAAQFPSYDVGLSGVVSVLSRHGLIEEEPPDIGRQLDENRRRNNVGGGGSASFGSAVPKRRWRLTRLGWATLEYLQEQSADDSGSQ